jgi:hypothetical protein
MKRRMVAIALILCICGSVPAYASGFLSPDSGQSESESGKQYVTSGQIYDDVMSVNENFVIYYDSEGYLNIEQDPLTIPENGEWQFILDTIYVLQKPSLEGQSKIKFIAGHDIKTNPIYEIFGTVDYAGPDSFTMIHSSMTTDADEQSTYRLAFNEYYGAHSVDPDPNYYNDSYYWIASCFGYKGVGTVKPDESTIDVQVPGYEDSDVGGAASALMAFNALSRYGKIKTVTPEILPNDKVNITCTAEGDASKIVFSLSSHWDGSSMYADSMTGSPNAMTGIKSAIDVIRKQGS